jgi:hypothetical protein
MTAIVCPWCGTNYTAFQSNCRNCGGTIPAPKETAERPARRAAAGELQFPAAPPREIAPNYIWKLFAQDGWVISAGIFALLGGIFSVTGAGLTIGVITAFVGLPFLGLGLLFLGGGGAVLYWRYQVAQDSVNVLKLGQAKEGEITALEPNYSVRINGRTPWNIRYTFSVDGKDYEGSTSTLNDPSYFMQAGSPAVVLYLPEKPESNQLYPHP